MAFTFGFYNALNHDRRYNAIQVSSIFDGIIKDGIFMSIGGHMNVKATGNGFNIVVESGRAWFNHTWSLLDADYPMVVSPSDVLEDRIDVVVLEVNENVDVRQNFIKIITGTPAESPTKPALTNNLDIHQYALAYITVPANSVTLTQSNVENAVGLGSTPFVTGILETINIDDLIAQWKSQWSDWTEEVDLNWNNWFDTVDNAWTTWFTQQQSKWEDILTERTEEWEEIKDTVDSEWASQQGSINSDYTNWKSSALAAYNQWLDQIKGTLDDDAATQLAKEVVELKNRDDVISTYQHVKSGTEHIFIGSGSNGKVKMTADIASGDKVVISSAPKEKVTVKGATSQPGSGDPSPNNIRMIDGVGMYDQCVVLDGSSDETWRRDENGVFVLFNIQGETLDYVSQTSNTAICYARSNSFKASSVSDCYLKTTRGTFTFPVATEQLGRVFVYNKGETLSEFKSYLQAHPLIIWYRSVEFYKCKGPFYYVHEVSDGTESPYKAIGIELNAPLFDGDSLEIGGLSGFDQMRVFDGSENWSKDGTADVFVCYDILSDYLPQSSNGSICNAISNNLAAGSISDVYYNLKPGYFTVAKAVGQVGRVFIATGGREQTAFKAELAAKPLIVFYKSVNYTPEADIAVALEKRERAQFHSSTGIYNANNKSPYAEIRIPSSAAHAFAFICNRAKYPGSQRLNYGDMYIARTDYTGLILGLVGSGIENQDALDLELKARPVQVVYELASSATYAHPIQTESLPAYYGTEDLVTALAGEPVTDKWLTFTNDGAQLNFKGGGGVGVSKLAATTAVPADVVQGKTFYSKDKTLKTGTLTEKSALTDAVSVGNDGNYLYARIPVGVYRIRQATGYPEIRFPNAEAIKNIPGGDNGAWNGAYSGSNVTIPQGYHNGSGSVGVAGGNRGNWGTTINPGGSVTIPQGYHAGGGVVRANQASVNAAFAGRIKNSQFGPEILNGNGASASGGTLIATTSSYFAWVLFDYSDINHTTFNFGWKNSGEIIATTESDTPNWVYAIRIWT